MATSTQPSPLAVPLSSPPHAQAVANRTSGRRRATLAVRHVVLIVLSFLTIVPVLMVVSTTLKTDADVKTNPFGLFTSFSGENIVRAWTAGHFDDYLLNSVLLSVPSTLLIVVVSTMAGYTFARLPFPGRTILFYLVVLGLLVPFFTYMIPLYFELRSMHLLDTWTGAVLVLTSTGTSFGTFFMRAFFSDLPDELEQAARIDGCSEWRIFTRVMLPLVSSGIGALAVFTFITTWNNFLVPLLYLPGGAYRPLTAGLYNFMGGRSIDIGPLAAGTLITILPIIVLFVVLQKQVTAGFISGSVKG